MEILTPVFLTAVIAAAVIGVSKGGFGGVGTVIAVPIMSLASSPATALGVLLPVLMLADLISVTSHWKSFDKRAVWQAVPGALVGVAAGTWLLASIDGAPIKVTIGVLSIAFALHSLWRTRGGQSSAAGPLGAPHLAPWFGLACGITSTLAHSGGPPIHMHYLARGFSPVAFVATSGVFMALVNLLKLGPYVWIGTVNLESLAFSLKLVPFVAAAAFGGVWMARRISRKGFSVVINLLMLVVGAKLLLDGAGDLWGI